MRRIGVNRFPAFAPAFNQGRLILPVIREDLFDQTQVVGIIIYDHDLAYLAIRI